MHDFFKSETEKTAELVELSFISTEVAEHYESLGMQKYWKERLEFLKFKSQQPRISDYKLMCGVYLFNQANKKVDEGRARDSVEVINYLARSAQFGNFGAIRGLNILARQKLKNNQWIEPQSVFYILNESEKLLGTPVYILKALTYLAYGEYYINQNKNIESNSAYQCAIQYLYAAELIEPYCKNEIHNAYYGKGIEASNPWKIKTCEELRKTVVSSLKFDSTIIERAQQEGKRISEIFTRTALNFGF
jgi:hypothetical protein